MENSTKKEMITSRQETSTIVQRLTTVCDYLENNKLKGISSLVRKVERSDEDEEILQMSRFWVPIAQGVICFEDINVSKKRHIKDLLRKIFTGANFEISIQSP